MSQMKIFKIIFLFLSFLIPLACDATDRDCVILLHGLARSPHSMRPIESLLKAHDYIVINEDYPTTKDTIDKLANQYIPLMVNQCLAHRVSHIDFVTHSMGGVVLEDYLENHNIPYLYRIVMLGPPNHGSELVNLFHGNYLFKYFTGPAGQELSTYNTSIPNTIHLNHQYQIGIIAGNFSMTPFNQYIFHGANDGKVSISSAKMNQMKDFIILPVSHTFMMNNVMVKKQILDFLENGKFTH